MSYKELVLDKTRQVKIIDNDLKKSKKIELFADGRSYDFYCKSGKYSGCGIDAAHAFMGWLDTDISRNKIKKYVETTDLTYDWINDGDTFTSPAEMAKGLSSLVKKVDSRYKGKIKKYQKNNNLYILNKIEELLLNGMPVVALINKGQHWVTLSGMRCKYKSNGKLDIKNTRITVIDLTKGLTYTDSFINLKICGWSSVGTTFYSSYRAGTIIGLTGNKLKNSSEKKAYIVQIHTSAIKHAGTDANIHLKVIGTNGKSITYKINTICNDFEKESHTIQSFIVEEYLGDLEAITLTRDNSGKYPGWHVGHINIQESTTKKVFHFPINQWIEPLDDKVYLQDSDNHKYEIKIETGDVKNAGTDAKVYIKLFGEYSKTSYLRLDDSKNNYEKGAIDKFTLYHKYIGPIKKIKVKHDNSGKNAGWFLEKISIKSDSKKYNFTAREWLSDSRRGALPEVTLLEDTKRIKYNITVRTSNSKYAGTDAGVYIQLFGTNGKSTSLQRIDHKEIDDFEKGSLGQYTIYANKNLGEINKLKLKHDNTGNGAWWKIDTIVVNNSYTFHINEWLGDDNKSIHPSKFFTR